MFKGLKDSVCPTDYDRLPITANNGITYYVCIPFSFIPAGLFNTKLKVYLWPLEILVQNGYLVKVAGSSPIRYNFVSTTDAPIDPGKKKEEIVDYIWQKPKTIIPPKPAETILPSDDQWISGIDNVTLIIVGLGLFLLFKN